MGSIFSTGNSASCFKIKFLAQDLFLMIFNQLCPKFSTFSPFKLKLFILINPFYNSVFSDFLRELDISVLLQNSSRLEDPNSIQVLTIFKRRSYVRPFAYSRYRTGASLQPRLMSLNSKLVPMQSREHEFGLILPDAFDREFAPLNCTMLETVLAV